MAEILKLSEQQLRALQLKELDILKHFRDFCESHSITYYVCGGCLIGSLRYGKFIPWDDDADVFMPRADYERFIKEYLKSEKENDRFVLLNETDDTFTRNSFATLVDTSATLIKNYQKDLDIPHGVAFDIFPIDPRPSGIKKYFQFFWCIIYSLFRAQTVPENHGGIMSLGSKFLLGIFRGFKTRKKIWKFAEKHMTKYKLEDCDYICELCAGPRIMKNEYPKELFSGTDEIEFEGEKFKAMNGYDEYLKIAFGEDYITPPPKEEQVISHDLAYLDLDKPCKIINN